jgi:DNA-binding NtrC family response regulator
MSNHPLERPRILVIDDFFGRFLSDRRNEDRENLCAQYLLRDITGDEEGKGPGQRILKPIADAVFFRGQRPNCSTVGDIVENDLPGCLTVINEGWNPRQGGRIWSLVLLDLCFYTGKVTEKSNQNSSGMPEGRPQDALPDRYFGLSILRAIQERFPELPVVILSSMPRESVSRQFSYAGALAFLDRSDPKSPALLQEYIRRHGLIPDDTGRIVGQSKALLLALRAARQAAENRSNILIRGPRGSGKELIASYINQHTPKEGETPFVIIDSGALNPQLYASELFGHKKGAFTGADHDRDGRVVQANGGDLFLDEIGNMPPEIQLGLLRALEQLVVTPIGGDKSKPVDVRFISATNEDIEERAATGKGFRLDLLDRLRGGATIILPPLNERKEDIPLLIERFIHEAEEQNPNALQREIDPSAIKKLVAYDWPGNVRELRQCIFSAVGKHPDVEHLVPVHIVLPSARSVVTELPGSIREDETPVERFVEPRSLEEILQDLLSFDFGALRRDHLEGRLPELQKACGEFVACYLKAVLEATKKPVERTIQLTPAVKMATGDAGIMPTQAKDIVKKLLKVIQPISDPLLLEAFQSSFRQCTQPKNHGDTRQHKKNNNR